MRQWALEDAKARLSEAAKLACEPEPQEIAQGGAPVVAVRSRAAFDRLTAPHESLLEFMQRSPLFGADEIELSRDPSLTREVEP